ncbi:hypothetical protein CVT25_014474 [Psilocybe cyanescens]|uniref:Uncharacterized protein n=1 Tax=Psilocybe cyanescens TaxID=93625 RepID=A0A409XRB2_PSICY|nr:hypothetical protein CVT25_014474 [Psilocybe cyanescens]
MSSDNQSVHRNRLHNTNSSSSRPRHLSLHRLRQTDVFDDEASTESAPFKYPTAREKKAHASSSFI